MEIETGTLLTLISLFFASVGAWWTMAFKFRDFYKDSLMSLFFYLIIGLLGLNTLFFYILINYKSKLEESLLENAAALKSISKVSEGYLNSIYFIWLVGSLYFLAWILLAIVMQMYENHEKKKAHQSA